MRLLSFIHVVATAATLATAHKNTLPPPTGPYHVALAQHVLEHITPNDPYAPNGTGTSILLGFYYPTLQTPNTTRPWLDYGLAVKFEEYFNWAPGSLSNLTTNIQYQASPLPANDTANKLPTLIFNPALNGPATQCSTALITELVSHGYVVITIDHPYEQPFLQYPYGGPAIDGPPVDYTATPEEAELAVTYRLSDIKATLEAWPGLVELYNAPFNTTHYAFFGHSIGGPASLNALIDFKNSTNLTALGGLNEDGSLFGASASDDSALVNTGVPTLLFGSEVHNDTIDPYWGTFTEAQSSWWREVTVKGAIHTDFVDTILFKQWNGFRTPGPGVIDAYRMVDLVRTFNLAFFDMLVTHEKQEVLQGPTAEWPEVSFYSGSDGDYFDS